MMRSLFSGFAGMRTQQQSMDVIGNNIANVNTSGYKATRVSFEDLLYQSLRSNSQETNPVQVGGGVRVGGIDTLFTQGSPTPTGNLMDLAITGDGFIVLNNNGANNYTRSGALSFNKDGYLYHSATGYRVMGWAADANGNVQPGSALVELRAIPGARANATASTGAAFSGLIDGRTPVGGTLTRDVTLIDGNGVSRAVTITLTRNIANPEQWDWSLSNPSYGALSGTTSGTITFDANGNVSAGGTAAGINLSFSDGITPAMNNLTLDFSALTMAGGESSISGAQVGGVAAGTLNDVTIDEFGRLVGVFSNGTSRVLGQIALATFTNENGLERSGNNMFVETLSSGSADTSTAPGRGRGKFSPGNLEMSNVDLTQEFASMILSQRAFQANSRVVTTTDEMLQEVVNLRR